MAGPQVEFVGIDESVIRELAEGRHAREVMELTALKREFKDYAQSPIGAHRSTEGLGKPILSVPALSYHYWREREGPEVWGDKQFQKEYLRDNPGARIASETPNRIGWRAPKFKKSYNWPCAL